MVVTSPSPRLVEIVAAAAEGGADIVQLRDRSASREQLWEMALQLRRVTRGRSLLVVNGDVEAALAADADGVHLPEGGAPIPEVRSRCGAALRIGRSVHSVRAAVEAEREGADYLVAGAVFASSSHPGEAPAGLEWLRRVCSAVAIPVIAIGGVTPSNAIHCIAAGAAGVAALSPIMRGDDPRAVALAYRRSFLGEVSAMIDLIVNGEPETIEEPMSISAFLEAHGLQERMVVVEHNRDIVPREQYGEVMLASGDQLEIVQMMAGG